MKNNGGGRFCWIEFIVVYNIQNHRKKYSDDNNIIKPHRPTNDFSIIYNLYHIIYIYINIIRFKFASRTDFFSRGGCDLHCRTLFFSFTHSSMDIGITFFIRRPRWSFSRGRQIVTIFHGFRFFTTKVKPHNSTSQKTSTRYSIKL